MTQTNSFSTIIRHATEHAKPVKDRQALVIIDAHTGQVAQRPNIFEALTGDFRYFLVTNSSDPNGVIKGTKRVKYKEGQGEITFTIEYAGGCQPGQEWRLAECFLKPSPLEDAVNNSLAKWLIEHFSGSLTIDDFDSESANACAALAAKARREFGLDLKVTLGLEGRGALETVDSGTLLVFSRMKDSDDEEGMRLRVELEVDPQRIPRALINQHRSFNELLEKGVRRYVSDYVTLEAFYRDFPTKQTIQALRDHLNGLLRPFGRKAGRISLKPDDASAPPKDFKGEAVIEYRHHEYPDPIKLNVSAFMTLGSPARYKAKNKPDLNEWLETNLSEVIDKTLFGISYVELLLGFALLKEKIDDSMNTRAHGIGYGLEQLVTILHLEPFEWLKRVDVEIKDTASDNGQVSEAMFETSLSNFYVGLEIILTARVRELRGIEDYLRTKQDVPQKMKEEIIRLVRKFMHGTNPERFYMRYSRLGDGSDELSFEEELRQKIHSLLKTEFDAEVIDLTLKPTQTELTRKRQEVSKGSHDFTAAAELGNLPGAPTMVVNGGFKVIRVSGWHAFKECDASVEAIRKRIVSSIRASLKVARDDQLSFSDESGFDTLVREAVRKAGELIDEEFGLAIKLTTVYWDWEDELKRLGRQQGQMELASVQERIMRLNELLLDLLENDAPPGDIKDVKDRIRRLSATLKPALASSAGIQQLPEPRTPKSLPPTELEQTDS